MIARPLLIGSALLALAACSNDDDDASMPDTTSPDTTSPDTTNEGLVDMADSGGDDVNGPGVVAASSPDGMRVTASVRNVDETIGAIETALDGNEATGIVANVNHAASAETVDIALRPTRVVLFGNPNLGTPLMQASRTAGLDLPQKMLAWENETGDTRLAWNSSAWLAARHGIEGEAAEDALGMITTALEGLATNASGQALENAATGAPTVTAGDGILTLASNRGFDETYAALKGAVEMAGPLTIVAELDHQANAARVELELPPTRLIVFGNPSLGSPLMAEQQSIGIDLPQKMLVYQEGDVVTIAWNDPAWTAARHGITDRDETTATIGTALGNLAAAAAGEADGS